MPLSRHALIPAFLSIDVEPNGFQLSRSNPSDWTGYGAMMEFADRMKCKLTERTGAVQKFGWYFRTDPQIAHTYGRPEHVLAEYPERIAQLQTNGDYFGVHAHPVRWCERRRLWIHDFADREWLAHCTRSSLDAYARWSGSCAQRFRAGAGFLANDIIAVIEQCGVKVELSLEPVASWGLTRGKVASAVDDSPMRGRHIDCRMAPRVAFRPARHDFRIAGGADGRDLVMIPLTTGPAVQPRPAWRKLARRLLLGSAGQEVLYPSADWPSARFYWDLITSQLSSMDRPYLSLAIRTDSPDSGLMDKVRCLFDELPAHPLAEQLRFIDPLEFAPELVSDGNA